MKTSSSFLACWVACLFACFFSSPLRAQSTAGGTVEGRVANDALGTYLTNARVTLASGHQTFTDEFGYYRLTGVPAGEARVRVFYTGMPTQDRTLTVAAGQSVRQDFGLGADNAAANPNAAVKLDSFVVAASRDMTAAALAVNEQRFTQNIKTVVSTDSFGDIADGNVGEFVKFMPGVSLGFSGGHAASISVGGMPPESTPIMIDGWQRPSP